MVGSLFKHVKNVRTSVDTALKLHLYASRTSLYKEKCFKIINVLLVTVVTVTKLKISNKTTDVFN